MQDHDASGNQDTCGYEDQLCSSPVSCKLKYLWNVDEPQLTKVVQHLVASWRP